MDGVCIFLNIGSLLGINGCEITMWHFLGTFYDILQNSPFIRAQSTPSISYITCLKISPIIVAFFQHLRRKYYIFGIKVLAFCAYKEKQPLDA